MKTYFHLLKVPRSIFCYLTALLAMLSAFSTTGCVSVKTEHRVDPIQITMDINVRLERELEQSFGALDARSREIAAKQSEKGAE